MPRDSEEHSADGDSTGQEMQPDEAVMTGTMVPVCEPKHRPQLQGCKWVVRV